MCTSTFIEQFEALKAENARLSERVRELEEELSEQTEKADSCCSTMDQAIDQCAKAESRLSQAEELLKGIEWAGVAEIDRDVIGNYCVWCGGRKGHENHSNDCRLATFLHPEQAEKAETIKHIDEVSAEVEQWPEDQQHLLGGFAEGFEKEKL